MPKTGRGFMHIPRILVIVMDIGEYIDGIVLSLVTKTINHAVSIAEIRADIALLDSALGKMNRMLPEHMEPSREELIRRTRAIVEQAANLDSEIADISRDMNEVMGSIEDMNEARLKADAESRSKSSFLARMSHELRTPMNVILGFSELAQREHGSLKALEYISGIRSAGAGLLAIINDILDFSKIESGNFPLAPAPYETGSMLNDALSIIRIRMAEKPIELILAIDPSLPAALTGDVTRVRQILLNILSNAVKYTEKGFIRLTVSWKETPGTLALLTFSVADSGIGIRSGDLPNLFSDFSRVEEQRNKSIEGTGLGLAITRSLCRAMGGEVTAESEYGKGSVFTVTLLQGISDRRPMGAVEHKAAARMEKQHIPFTAPDAEILLVDDLPSNLMVAEGLLSPYEARIFTCHSGHEAVELVGSRSFDLVFMDHMMPGMDGLEATAAIRAMRGRGEMPIIALTANAVSGMKEMFLQNGFNDFLSKPIEVFKLAEIMEKWIPPDKRCQARDDAASSTFAEVVKLPELEGVDALAGLAHVGGTLSRYLNLLEMFCRDARTRLPRLVKTPGEAERKDFTMQVHALKSALASIGAADLSMIAARLEDAGRIGDMSAIHDDLDAFRVALAALLERTEAALAGTRLSAEEDGGGRQAERERELLVRLQEALKQEDIDSIDNALEDLKILPLTFDMRDALSYIAAYIISAEFTKAIGELDPLLKIYGDKP
jgi:signal transduction histidine kinase/CheY-like chemotaxis protein